MRRRLLSAALLVALAVAFGAAKAEPSGWAPGADLALAAGANQPAVLARPAPRLPHALPAPFLSSHRNAAGAPPPLAFGVLVESASRAPARDAPGSARTSRGPPGPGSRN